MRILFSDKAQADLQEMDADIRATFIKHAEKLVNMPPRRHMRFGIPFNVEDVTRQARMVYDSREGELEIVRCFSTHKEYEKWYKSFK